MVFWILFWLAAAVLILLISHLFGVKVFNIADKIYKSFSEPEDGKEKEVDEDV